jgi:hypothetical protein
MGSAISIQKGEEMRLDDPTDWVLVALAIVRTVMDLFKKRK